MMRTPGRYSGRRYRGSRGPSVWPVLVVAVILIAAAGTFWLHRHRAAPAPQVPGPDSAVSAMAAVPDPTPEPEPEPAGAEMPEPPLVKGIYITSPIAGSEAMQGLVSLVEETELNAMVIDVKNDEGKLTYIPEEGTARELGFCVRYIQDLPGLVASLKERGIYTIARVCAFKDPQLAAARPELALRRTDGTLVSEGNGQGWVNPYESEVWDYLAEIALGAAQIGFDEVQFDYVRFPTVKNIQSLDFGSASEGIGREEIIVSFLDHVRGLLHEKGVWLSADVFGTVIDSQLDAGLIGQNYPAMSQAVDFICPMIYPSHYAAGAYGLELPDRAPYETVYAALGRSQTALSAVDQEMRAGVRSWLQGFTATWVQGHANYGAEELRAQIQAVYDAGYSEWIIWNANNSYSSDGLLPTEGP